MLRTISLGLHLPFLLNCRAFDVRLENPHVIDASQVWVGVVSNGPSGRPLNSSYRSRDSIEYKLELGNTIGMICSFKQNAVFSLHGYHNMR